MNIYFIEMKKQKLISCNFIIPVGMNDKWRKNKSFAHLIEHLLFRGHPNFDQFHLMQKIENFGGIINACTDDKHTEVYVRVEEKHLVEVVDLLYEAIASFDISLEDIQEERRIIGIEEEQDYVGEMIQNNILGFEKKYTAIFSKKELKEIYRKYYQLNKWHLLIFGDVSEDTKKYIKKYLNDQKEEKEEKEQKKIIHIPDYPIYKKIYDGLDTYFVYYHPLSKMCEKRDMKIIKYLLTSGLSSRLYKLLVDENSYTYQINFRDIYYDRPAFIIFFVCRDKDFEELRSIFENIFTKPGFTDCLMEVELIRAINMTVTEYYLKSESVSSFIQDYIASFLAKVPFIDFEQTIKILLEQDTKELKDRLKKFLFHGEK